MTTKAMSVADAEQQLDSARQQLNNLEGRLRSGSATLEEHVSAQQFFRFAEDVLENARAREVEAAEKAQAEQRRAAAVEKAKAEIPRLEEETTASENLRAALLDYVDILRGHGRKRLTPDLFGVVLDTLRSEIRGGADGGALDQLRWMDTPYKPNSNVIEGLRTELKTQKQILAASNGSHTKGKTA
jgi:hypothetical protein